MSVERTLSIVKPDATEKNVIGKILTFYEEGGLKIVASKMLTLTKEQASKFYEVHKERPFYQELVDYMTSGRILVSVLEGENAISKNREIMGATNPSDASSGTIRKEFGENIERNAVHGSDAPETAKEEIKFFFPDL